MFSFAGGVYDFDASTHTQVFVLICSCFLIGSCVGCGWT